MTKPLTELFDEMVSFKSLENYWNVPSFIVGSQDETNCGDPIHLATKGLIEALEFYARGLSDLEPKPEKAHLYTEDFDMNSIEWRQRSMSDYWSGKIARQALAEFRASLEDV